MNVQEYIQYKNITGTPGAAWVHLIQNNDEYKTLAQGHLKKDDPLYVRYAKILYDDVNNFFIDLSKEINLSSDIYDILIFIMHMGEHCTPFVTKKVLDILSDIMDKMNFHKHVDIVYSMISNQNAMNLLLDEYIRTNDSMKIHKLFFMINMYKTTDTFNRIQNLDDILSQYKTYLSGRNISDTDIVLNMNLLTAIKRI